VTAAQLWKRMTAEQRRRAASALWGADDAGGEQKQAELLIARHMKSRPKTVSGLDGERKARYLAAVADLPDEITAKVLVLYHLAEQRPMMAAFLDALGIAHEDGLIQGDVVAPDAARVSAAAAVIARAYPVDDVSLYLRTLLWQDPATWGALEGVPAVTGGSDGAGARGPHGAG
jgi:hypothetical protein